MKLSKIDPKAAKLLDELLVLFDLYECDYDIVRESLQYISKCRQSDPQFPITISLSNFMCKRDLIE